MCWAGRQLQTSRFLARSVTTSLLRLQVEPIKVSFEPHCVLGTMKASSHTRTHIPTCFLRAGMQTLRSLWGNQVSDSHGEVNSPIRGDAGCDLAQPRAYSNKLEILNPAHIRLMLVAQ